MKAWRKIQLMGDWGYEQFFVCPDCGAIVQNRPRHRFIEEMAKEAQDGGYYDKVLI
jgi:hypothetical protein